MDFSVIAETYPNYFSGLWVTLGLLAWSLAYGMVLALAIGVMRASKQQLLAKPAWAFIYFFRGTPLLVQMYVIYYGFPQFAVVKETFLWHYFQQPMFCAILALTLNNAGYTAEIIYNGIVTVNRGEIEAAKAFGMGRGKMFRFVVLPSVIYRSLPAYTNEMIFMLHATALVSLITITDLTGVARAVYARYYAPFEAFLFVAVFYMIITFAITSLMRLLERKVTAFR